MNILVTGASGFVGRTLVPLLASNPENRVWASSRRPLEPVPNVTQIRSPDHEVAADWRPALAESTPAAVVHLAARVHQLGEQGNQALDAYRQGNTTATIDLAREAASRGVKRFIFVSSVKVHGESGELTEASPTVPVDAYGVSKLEAEVGLRAIANDTGMEVVIIRPPLVYGPGVKANFAALMRVISRGVPLPLASIHNRRSFVGVENLADLIAVCLRHPAAANEIFLVSDGDDMSTPDLIRRLARAMNRSARLLPVPPVMLRLAGTALGKGPAVKRLLGTLTLSPGKARSLLGWTPPVSVDTGFQRLVAATGDGAE